MTDYYFGRGMPELALYVDGQLVVRRDDNTYETKLSSAEVKKFLARITATGFFSVEGDGNLGGQDPIYQFPADAQYTDGAGSRFVFVSDGVKSKYVYIYGDYLDYVVPNLRQAYDLIINFNPPGLQPYRPLQMVLWIEQGDGADFYDVTPEPATLWPSDLPSIRTLGIGHVILPERLILRIVSLFAKLPSGQVFVDAGVSYVVIARPLLPNESPSDQW